MTSSCRKGRSFSFKKRFEGRKKTKTKEREKEDFLSYVCL